MPAVMNVAELANSVVSTRVVSYVGAGGIAILVYDSLLTLDREIRTIWMAKLTLMKFMYLLTRYSAMAEAGVVVALLTIPGDRYDQCSLVFKLNVALFVFGLGAGEIIMTIRTWAVWRKNTIMMYTLPVFYLVIWSGAFATTGIFLSKLEFKPDPRTAYVGCYATGTDPIIFVPWVLLLLYDAVMFFLMAIPTVKIYRSGSSSRFLRIVHRDGVVYYLYLFVLSLANIIITLTFPSDLILVFSLMSRIIHAILSCRVVLHIDEHGREVITSDSDGPSAIPVTIRTRPRGKSQTQQPTSPQSPQFWQTVYVGDADNEAPSATPITISRPRGRSITHAPPSPHSPHSLHSMKSQHWQSVYPG